MRNKIALILLFCGIFINQVFSQECYTFGLQKGIESFNEKKYAEALQKFEGTMQCPDVPPNNDLATWIERTKKKIGLSKSPDKNKPLPLVQTVENGNIHWSEQYIETTGKCVIDYSKYQNKSQAILVATYCAEAIADASLVEIIKGIHISRTTTIKDFALINDQVNIEFNDFIRGAYTFGEPIIKNDIVEVKRRAPINQLGKWISNVSSKLSVYNLQDVSQEQMIATFSMSEKSPDTSGWIPIDSGRIITIVTLPKKKAILFKGNDNFPAWFILKDIRGNSLFSSLKFITENKVDPFRIAAGKDNHTIEDKIVVTVTLNSDGSYQISDSDWIVLQGWINASIIENRYGSKILIMYSK